MLHKLPYKISNFLLMTILGLLPIIDDFAVRREPLAQKTSGFV
jgi:hypothetical protein